MRRKIRAQLTTIESWVASVDAGGTASPEQAQAIPSTGSGCNSGQFQVRTFRGSSTGVTDVAFFVVIG